MTAQQKRVIALKKPTKRKRGEARQHVLDVALDLFSTVGFDGVTTRGLADACGVNHSLITYHFGDKMGLWIEVMTDIFQAAQDNFVVRTEGLGELEPEVSLKIGIRAFVSFSKENPALHRIMTIEGRSQTDRLKWLVDHYLQNNFDNTIAQIKAGQKRGKINKGDPARLYYCILSIGGSAFAFAPEFNLLTGSKPSSQPDIEEIVTIIEKVIFVGAGA